MNHGISLRISGAVRFGALVLIVGHSPVTLVGQPSQRCAVAECFAAPQRIHPGIFAGRTLLTTSQFLELTSQIQDGAAREAALPQQTESAALVAMSDAFELNGDHAFLLPETRRAFLKRAGWWHSYAMSVLPYNHDTILDLLIFALSSEGACTDPTFRYALEVRLADELHWRAIQEPVAPSGQFFYDHAIQVLDAWTCLAGSLGEANPQTLSTYAFSFEELGHLAELVSLRLTNTLGTAYLTPEQTDNLLKHPAILSSEAYRVRMHMLKTPNEPIRQNSR